MLLHLHRPGPPLDRFVELVTYYAGYRPEHSKERLLPDGAVEIVVDLTDTPKKLYDRDDHTRSVGMRRAWISGMRRRWIVIEAAPGASMVVIRFRPGGAYPFLGFAVEEVGYSQRHVLGLFRRWVGLPPKQYGRLRRFQQVLTSVTSGAAPVDAAAAAELRAARPPEPDWAEVAALHGYFDQSHLVRDFREFAGLTPRGYLAAYRGLENYLPID